MGSKKSKQGNKKIEWRVKGKGRWMESKGGIHVDKRGRDDEKKVEENER